MQKSGKRGGTKKRDAPGLPLFAHRLERLNL
jgi:hypothetical protein